MASTTVLSSEQEAAMSVATKLAIALLTIVLSAKLGAQQTAVIIDLTQQTAYLLEDGRVAFVSPIASGREGWGTPIGSFRIISKDLNHQSGNFGQVIGSYGRIVNPNATPGSYVPPGCHYIPAPMPYFMEFSKSVGMHAGYLPGYPASHGCVRMPRDLAAEFFARVTVGTPVKVIGSGRNVTRVRRAIPIVQPGNSGYAIVFSNPRQVSGSARNSAPVRRAIPVVQPRRSQYTTILVLSITVFSVLKTEDEDEFEDDLKKGRSRRLSLT
jgi:L,D-transpeptidase-like protein